MKILILLLLFYVASSCAFIPSNADVQNIKGDMALLNNRILGKIRDKTESTKLHELNSCTYKVLIQKYGEESDKEYIDFYIRYSPDTRFKNSQKDFGICIKSLKARIFLCDDAFTGRIDTEKEKVRDMALDINEEIQKLILKR